MVTVQRYALYECYVVDICFFSYHTSFSAIFSVLLTYDGVVDKC